MPMRRTSIAAASMLAAAIVAPGVAREPEAGVKVGNPSFLRKLVSAEKIEQTAELQYGQIRRQAYQKRALLPDEHPQVRRVRKIAQDLLPHALKFNERAKDWHWEVNIINSHGINAFCMPGGKIAFFTGILDRLQLTDDEVAMVAGHEIAHALREHARERVAKSTLTNFGALAVSVLVGGRLGEIARVGGGLLNLKFSRSDETESDLIGMELAARAGYDPRAGVTLWEKMSRAARGGQPLQWFSTHPSSAARIDTIKNSLKDVMPLYERAKAALRG